MRSTAVVAAIAKELDAEAITFVGMRHLAENASPPRYVWVPRTGRYGGADKPRGLEQTRALRTRSITFEVHVWDAGWQWGQGTWADGHRWGDAFGATEARLLALLEAVHHVAVGSYTLGTERWIDEEHVDLGQVVTVEITFDLSVLETPPVLVTVESVELDSGTADNARGDGVLDYGES